MLADIVEALGGSGAALVTTLRCFCFNDKGSAWGWKVEGVLVAQPLGMAQG
jgi:hypothetical protein